jgi:RNA polymerase sigma factor (sigma-70 family)
VDSHDWLADRFEAHRAHLAAVAYRMLGSRTEAEDAVQEAWLRLNRTDASELRNLGGWLTTVVARVSLDMLRSRAARREDPLDAPLPAEPPSTDPGPEHEAVLADTLGPALLLVLETLSPAERLAFVLHDMFAVPFDEIAEILGRTPDATKQLASRARRRVRGQDPATSSDQARQREVVKAFLAASRNGDFQALLALLHPDVVLRADPVTVATGAAAEVSGADAVAQNFAGRARAARLSLIDGQAGLVWFMSGQPKVAFAFTVVDGQVSAIELIGDPDRLAGMRLQPLTD